MKTITAQEADQGFSRFLDEAEAGEEIVITRGDRPVAVLAPYRPPAMTPERQAAVEEAIRLMEQGLPLGMTTRFSREELYDERIEELMRRRKP